MNFTILPQNTNMLTPDMIAEWCKGQHFNFYYSNRWLLIIVVILLVVEQFIIEKLEITPKVERALKAINIVSLLIILIFTYTTFSGLR